MIEVIKGSEFDYNIRIGSYHVSVIDIIGYGDSTIKIVNVPQNEIVYYSVHNIIGGKKTATLLVYYLIRLSNLCCMQKAPDKEKRILKTFLLLIGVSDFDFNY